MDIFANPVTMEAFRELKVFYFFETVQCAWTLNRTHHNTSKSSMVAEFADNEAFRESKVLLGSC